MVINGLIGDCVRSSDCDDDARGSGGGGDGSGCHCQIFDVDVTPFCDGVDDLCKFVG